MVSLILGQRPPHQVAGGLDWVGTTEQRNIGLICCWHEKRAGLSPILSYFSQNDVIWNYEKTILIKYETKTYSLNIKLKIEMFWKLKATMFNKSTQPTFSPTQSESKV